MKTPGMLVLFVVLFAARGPSENVIDPAQAPSAIKITRAAQVANPGIAFMGHSQILILLLVVMLVVIMLLGLAAYLIIRHLIGIQRTFRQHTVGWWSSGTKAHWRKSEDPDLNPQMLIEQHWLLTQLLALGHEDADIDMHDPSDLPTDWWG